MQRVERHRDVELAIERKVACVGDTELGAGAVRHGSGLGLRYHPRRCVHSDHRTAGKPFRDPERDESVAASHVEHPFIAREGEFRDRLLRDGALEGADVGVALAVPIDHDG